MNAIEALAALDLLAVSGDRVLIRWGSDAVGRTGVSDYYPAADARAVVTTLADLIGPDVRYTICRNDDLIGLV
jgi:hypothetical protein